MDTNVINQRETDFYAQLNLSSTTIHNYRSALNSNFLKDLLKKYGLKQLFSITDLELLWKIYSEVNLHPKNIRDHRAYSAAIMKYIRFLNNGQKYGKRIDYQSHRSNR